MIIENKKYNFDEILELFFNNAYYELKQDVIKNINDGYIFLLENLTHPNIYGLNTGFGPMVNYSIPHNKIIELQYNLIRSHAVGLGNPLPPEFSKYILLTRLVSLSKGYSSASPALIFRILHFLNNKIYPVVYEHGSVGASGDLVQLADIMRSFIGEGYVYYNNEIIDTKKIDLPPFELGQRDGLAFINGTSVMTAIGLYNIYLANILIKTAIDISSIIIELFNSYDDAFSIELNSFKEHYGQSFVAMRLTKNLEQSTLISKRFQSTHYSPNIQEIYSIRCVPQILGPIYDTFQNAKNILVTEFNSISDNPIFDYKNKKIYFGGNFHGDYVSFEMDKLKIAITKLSILQNRQLVLLLNNDLNKRFPPFLNYQTLGLNLGLQGTEFISASTTAENQTLSYPNYLHNIVSNKDNQDVVSMGTNSALIANKILLNTFDITSVLLLAIMQLVKNANIFSRLSNYHQNFLLDHNYDKINFNSDDHIKDNLLLIKNSLKV